MTVIDIPDRSAVGGHIPAETPFSSQDLIKQQVACTAGLAPETVVGSHHRICFTRSYKGVESREVCIVQVAFAAPGVEAMPVGFRTAMYRVMLGSCNNLEILRIAPLEAFYKCNAYAACEKRVFAIGLLSAPPSGIPENIDIG